MSSQFSPRKCLRGELAANVFAGRPQQMSSRVAPSEFLPGSPAANVFAGRSQQMSARAFSANVFAGRSQEMSSRAARSKCLRELPAANVFAGRSSKCLRGSPPAHVFAGRPQQMYSLDISATGTRTRVARVRAEYPNQLDYSGSRKYSNCACSIIFAIEPTMAKLGAWTLQWRSWVHEFCKGEVWVPELRSGEVGCLSCAAETKKAFTR